MRTSLSLLKAPFIIIILFLSLLAIQNKTVFQQTLSLVSTFWSTWIRLNPTHSVGGYWLKTPHFFTLISDLSTLFVPGIACSLANLEATCCIFMKGPVMGLFVFRCAGQDSELAACWCDLVRRLLQGLESLLASAIRGDCSCEVQMPLL